MEKRWKLRNGRSLRGEFSVFLTLIIGQGKEPFPFRLNTTESRGAKGGQSRFHGGIFPR